MQHFHQLIKEICQEEKICFQLLSEEWLVVLQKETQIHYIMGYKFDLNGHGLGEMLDDKFAFYEALKAHNIPLIPHHLLHKTTPIKEISTLFRYYNSSIVLKSNTGTCGREVFWVTQEKDLEPLLQQLFMQNISVSLCPFWLIKIEYRVIVLDQDVLYIYGKERPIVLGNGKSTIKELLKEWNPAYFNKKHMELCLENRILNVNETFSYSWKFNLSQGARITEDISPTKKEALIALAQAVVKATGIRFASIDIIEQEDGSLAVLEANSGVMLDQFIKQVPKGQRKAKEIYHQAIRKMFL